MNNAQFFPKTEFAKDLFKHASEDGPFKLIKEINGEYLFANVGAIYGTTKKGEKGFIKFKYWFLVPKDEVVVFTKNGSVW